VEPPPPQLWSPPPGAVPASGSFVYLQSDPGDDIGRGATHLYTPDNAAIIVTGGFPLAVAVTGTDNWDGSFAPMSSLSQVAPGYYGDLRRWPFNNPAKGGLQWSGNGRGCNSVDGWFAVDEISYVGGEPASLDMRFEQRCNGASAALHGRIRWSR
jgi:hypothetical protein